jgi:integrase
VSNLRKVPYTKPIPEGAETFTRKGKRFARWTDKKGKRREAPLNEAGDRIQLLTSKWYGEWKDPDGTEHCEPLATDKVAAEQMLAALVRKAELKHAGVADPFEEHSRRPLLEHLEDYRRFLLAKGDTEEHADTTHSHVRAVLDGCGFVFIADLDAGKVSGFLRQLRQDRPRPELPAGQELFTKAELVAALGIHPDSVRRALRCHGLKGVGQSKARRYPRATVEGLLERLCRGIGVSTSNHYLVAMKGFTRWLAETDPPRADRDRLASLRQLNAEVDVRRGRRDLEADELRRLLQASRESGRSFRGLTGPDRHALYATACGTGFRASGLASLTPESFDLDADPPTATLAARRNKSRVVKVQPLPPDLAALLRHYLQGRPAGQPVWGGTWARNHRGAEMLRLDLEAAGIPYVVEGPDGPEYADFHSLRHTYLTLGGRAGIDLRTLQELAGHSSPNLTARYSHRRLHDLAGAVEKLPPLLPAEPAAKQPAPQAALRATGTEGAGAKAPPGPTGDELRTPDVLSLRQACAAGEAGSDSVRAVEAGGPGVTAGRQSQNARENTASEGDGERLRAIDGGGPGGTRSRDPEILLPVLLESVGVDRNEGDLLITVLAHLEKIRP